ncbi:MAG: hypothetical protein RL033_908, partial [Pseudomonadota bacterium]
GLKLLQDEGASASEQILRLGQAMGVFTDEAKVVREAGLFGTQDVLLGLGAKATGDASNFKFAPPGQREQRGGGLGGFLDALLGVEQVPLSNVAPRQDAAAIQAAIDAKAKEIGAGPGRLLTDEQLQALARAAADAINVDGLTAQEAKELRDATYKNLYNDLVNQKAAAIAAARGGGVTQDQINALLNPPEGQPGLDDVLKANVSQADPRRPRSTEYAQRINRDFLRGAVAAFPEGDAPVQLLQTLAQAEADYSKTAFERYEKRREALQAVAKTPAAVRRAGRQALLAEGRIAADNGDVNTLIAIFNQATKTEQNLVIANVRTLRNRMQVQRDIAVRQAGQARFELGIVAAGLSSDPTVAAAEKALDQANKALDAALAAAGESVPVSGDDSAYSGGSGKVKDLQDQALQREIARIQAGAFSGSALSEASTAIRVAQLQLKAADKNSAEYWQAVKALKDAQAQYAAAQLDYAKELRLSRIDITDPVALARAEVVAAQRQLDSDRRRNAPRDVILRDQNAVRQARASAEREAWNQQFQDTQTNYELGRITYTAYVSYLQRQHDLLAAIKNKTRDQIEELNQVDAALKAAKEALQGQFNLGDIKVPTPYEVRRSIAASGAGIGYQGGGNTTIVTISGTDLPAVRALLEDVLGPAAASRGTVTIRRN